MSINFTGWQAQGIVFIVTLAERIRASGERSKVTWNQSYQLIHARLHRNLLVKQAIVQNTLVASSPSLETVFVEINQKIIVVTGAGSGIGRALVEKFTAEGAKQVIAVDIDAANAAETARASACLAMTADVACEADMIRVIDDVETQVGPIDLFCSNAGLAAGPSEQSPDQEWQISWDVNVMAHVYAARHLVPRMIKRGGGYLLNTASAAGLLNQIGGAAYGVTKHAAVGFGEWLALTYGHQGIKVSLLCPQAVRTAMTTVDPDQLGTEGLQAAAGDGMLEANVVADIVAHGLQQESFLILPHPEVTEYMQRKTADYDRWIKGMNRFHQSLAGD